MGGSNPTLPATVAPSYPTKCSVVVICVFGKAWLACVKLGRAPIFGSEYSSMYDRLEGVKGACLQGWWVSRVRMACVLWMIGEGLTEKSLFLTYPAYLAPNMFAALGRACMRMSSKMKQNTKGLLYRVQSKL